MMVKFNSPTPLGFRGSPIFLDRIEFLNEIAAPNGSFLDGVTVGAVPEPSSLALLGMASSAGLAYWRKRKAKS